MIPQAFITEWQQFAPWALESQVEQDLVLSRAIIEIFSEPFLANTLAFRGGTALHKLFINPAMRYSEDIDLVQMSSGPIGQILETLRAQLNPWLGEPRWKSNKGRATLIYRFESENQPITPMRLKIEINTREHFTVLGYSQKIFEIQSRWFSQKTMLTTFQLEEIMATKLRALYQRKKGRDLFDLVVILKKFPELDIDKLLKSFHQYMAFDHTKVSRAEFEANLAEKLNDEAFIGDIFPLLPTGNDIADYHPVNDAVLVQELVINHLHGEAWKGKIV